MIMLLGPFTKVRLWPSSLVVSPQKRATVNQETAEATDKHARLNEQAHGPFPWGNGGRKNVVHQQKRHPDSKASCSESRLILIRALSECALYRQTEQERHFRWRGWMLRPRVIRSPTNPKWDRSRVRVPLRAACSFCFLFCRLSLFFKNLRLLPSPSGFCQFLGSVRSSRNARFGLDNMSMVRTLELGSGKPPFLGGLRLRIRICIRIRLTLSFAFNI